MRWKKEDQVDVDTMEITIQYEKGKSLSDDKIKEIIKGAGFETVSIK